MYQYYNSNVTGQDDYLKVYIWFVLKNVWDLIKFLRPQETD